MLSPGGLLETATMKLESTLRAATNAIRQFAAACLDLARDVPGGERIALRRLNHHWNALGERDALGSVLSRPDDEPGWDVDAFFSTGRTDVARIMANVDRLAPSLPKRRALDFGCGIGRLALALADYFDEVRGIDIAESMIAGARQRNRVPERCQFDVNRRPDLGRFAGGTFDLVYSRLVLQHIPPRLMTRYIQELVRVLAPGGILVFQLPTEIDDPTPSFWTAPVTGGALKRSLPRWLVQTYRWCKYPLFRTIIPHMEIFGMARVAVVQLIEGSGARILAIEPDGSHGTDAPGFQYWATKSSPRQRSLSFDACGPPQLPV